MMIEQHYDEEILIALLDEQTSDPHLQVCATCRASMNSIRQVTTALHDETVWDRRELHEEPRPATTSSLRMVASSVASEDAAAEPWVKALLARPACEWRAMFAAHSEWRTAGFVRKLVAAVDAINFTSPADAVDLTGIAVEVAEGLKPSSQRLAILRAAALREHGYALYYVGRFPDAVRRLQESADLLASAPAGAYDLARTRLHQGYVFSVIDRLGDAKSMFDEARTAFVEFGDTQRRIVADMAIGTLHMRARRFDAALPVMHLVINDDCATTVTRATAYHNAAYCYRELGRYSEAKKLLASAIDLFEQIGAVAQRTNARWQLSRVFLLEGNFGPAFELLKSLRDEMRDLGMAHDVALSSIDMAEGLLMLGRISEVPELCRSAMEYFATAELTYSRGALTAIAYLREAAESKSLTQSAVKQVREFFEILPKQPQLLFARPA